MDIGTFQSIWTVVVLVTFVAIIIWAWSSRRKKEFDEAAKGILDDSDEDIAERNVNEENNHA